MADTNINRNEAFIARARRENIAAVMRGRALTIAAMERSKRDSKHNKSSKGLVTIGEMLDILFK